MACNITLKGIGFDCGTNLSGVRTLYIGLDASIGHDRVTVDSSSDLGGSYISAIDASAGTFKEYKPAKNTGSLTKTLTKDETTGVKYYTNEAVAQFNKMDIPKREELANLDGGQLVVIVEDMNGEYWFLGKDNYVSASAVTGQTGAGIDDGNFYTLTLTDISAELPYTVLASAVAAVI